MYLPNTTYFIVTIFEDILSIIMAGRNRNSQVSKNSSQRSSKCDSNISQTELSRSKNEISKEGYCDDRFDVSEKTRLENVKTCYYNSETNLDDYENDGTIDKTEIRKNNPDRDFSRDDKAANINQHPRRCLGRARFMRNQIQNTEIKPGLSTHPFPSSNGQAQEISSRVKNEKSDDRNMNVKKGNTQNYSVEKTTSGKRLPVSYDCKRFSGKSRENDNRCYSNSTHNCAEQKGVSNKNRKREDCARSLRRISIYEGEKDCKKYTEKKERYDRKSRSIGSCSGIKTIHKPREFSAMEENVENNCQINDFKSDEKSEEWDDCSWDINKSVETDYESENKYMEEMKKLPTEMIRPHSSNLNVEATPYIPSLTFLSYKIYPGEGLNDLKVPQIFENNVITTSYLRENNSYNLSKDSCGNISQDTDQRQTNHEEDTSSTNDTSYDRLNIPYSENDYSGSDDDFSSNNNCNDSFSTDQSRISSRQSKLSERPIKVTKKWVSPIKSRGDKIGTETHNVDHEQYRRCSQEINRCGNRRSLDSLKEKRMSRSRRSIEVFRREDFCENEEEKGFNPFQNRRENINVNLIELSKDLFDVSEDYSLAHCVAADFCMGSGIATEFRRRFGSVDELRDQKAFSGSLAFLKRRGRFIYYLVTKEFSRGKPTYKSLWSSLKCLREHIYRHAVNKLAIPRIACGLDGLDWFIVKKMLQYLFFTSKYRPNMPGFEILVCSHNPETTGKRTSESERSIDTTEDSDSLSWNVISTSQHSRLSTENFYTVGDPECADFDPYSFKRSGFVMVKEIEKNLFTVDETYSLAHCVAEDFSMGSGIAIEFRRRYNSVADLMNQRRSTGEVAILDKKDGRFIYYLVTKEYSCNKPTYESLWMCLKRLRRHISIYKVRKLAMPKIGCGLDKLDWNIVKSMMEYLFYTSVHKEDLEAFKEILVCDFQQVESPSVNPIRNSCIVLFEKYHISQIDKRSLILYFASRDMQLMESEHMTELNERHRFLRESSDDLNLGEVVRYESYTKRLIFYGCIVKREIIDNFDFVSFNKCLRWIRKQNQNDEYRYLSLQKLRDDILNEKILNLMRYTLRDVKILCCCGAKDVEIRD